MKTSTKAIILAISGYILTNLSAYFVIYPLFGITLAFSSTFLLGFIFTAIAFVSNYICLNAIEYFIKEKYIEE